VPAVIIAVGVQALVAVQVGLLLGIRVGERIREGAERVAGLALLALAAYLLAEHLLAR
jgi:manganese efflux pump family protein